MNTLSVLIYFAGVSEYIRDFSNTLLGVLAVSLIPVMLFVCVTVTTDDDENFKAYWSFIKSKIKYYVMLFVFAVFISIFVPTKNTIMLIAASEFGEIAMRSEQMTSIVNPSFELLKTWIDATTQELKDKSK